MEKSDERNIFYYIIVVDLAKGHRLNLASVEQVLADAGRTFFELTRDIKLAKKAQRAGH